MAQEHLKMDKMQELQRCKLWMQQQLIDGNTQLIKCRLDQEDVLQPSYLDSSISEFNERISKLQEHLLASSSSKSYIKVLLDRLLEGDVLIKVLFPDTTIEQPSEEDLSKMNEVAALCERSNDLCSTILEHHKELLEIQQQLNKVKQKNFDIKKVNREMMSKLQNLKDRRSEAVPLSCEDSAIQQAQHMYQHAKSKLNLTANIFQALVVGSGINWAADDHTRQLVVSLGDCS